MKRARIGIGITVALGFFSATALAADITLHTAPGSAADQWYAQFVFSKARFGQQLVIENPVCAFNQPLLNNSINKCNTGTSNAQQCTAGLTTPTALFDTTDPPNHCPAICPGGNTGGGQQEITCFAQDSFSLFQLFLGSFPDGQSLQSKLGVDQDRNGTADFFWHSDPTKDNDLMPDGTPFDHLRATEVAPGAIRMEWEDLPFAQSDLDFNDGVYLLLRYPGSGIALPPYKFGNTIAKQPLSFVAKVDIDDTDQPAPRMIHLTITVYNEDANAVTIGVCPMLSFPDRTIFGTPPCQDGQVTVTQWCYFESCQNTPSAIPSPGACKSPDGCSDGPTQTECDDPSVRLSLTNPAFVPTVGAPTAASDIKTVPGATSSGATATATVWEYAARLDQFNPPLDGKTAQQILQQILSTPEQTYVDFFVMPPGGLGTLNPPMKDPFVCPSGVNVHTHLEGVSKLPFAFAWTAPVQEINSPTTFKTSMRNEVTMGSTTPVQAQTELVWRESDPGNPIGITYNTTQPPRETFTMDPTVEGSGYGSITYNFPPGVAEGFMGIATQYTTDVNTGKNIVVQSMRSVKDTHAPHIEAASIARDNLNKFNVQLNASDSPATIQSIKLKTIVDGGAPLPAFMRFQSGNYLTTTGFGSAVAPVPPASTIVMQAIATDEVGNAVTSQLPVAHAGVDRAVECTSPAGAQVTLDGSRSTGAGTLSFQWAGPFGTATGATPARQLPLGTSTVALSIADASGFTSSDSAQITVQDTTPPTITLPTPAASSICANSATVTVGQATATDVRATGLTPTGQLISANGVAVVPPVPVVSGQAALRAGTNTIRWTVSDGHGNTTTRDQIVVVGSKIQAGLSFLLDDRAQMLNTSGGFAPVLSSGTGSTRIGQDCKTGGVISRGPVTVQHRAVVNGNVLSAGTVTKDGDATVTGTITGNGTVSLPALPTLPTCPAATLGGFTVNAGQTMTKPPGSYTNGTVINGGTLNLQSGDYFFQSLTINAGSTVRVPATTRVFVRDNMIYNAPFLATSGSAVQTVSLFGFAGTTTLSMTAAFNGSLVAPNATVLFGSGSGITYTGSFFGRTMEVNPGSTLVCKP